MQIFKRVRDQILESAFNAEKGEYPGIPVPFPRLAEYIPTWDKGMSIGVLGGTGVGKSSWTRFTFLYDIYDFYKKTGYKVKILYLPLEDNATKVYKSAITHYLYVEHGITISMKELDSKCGTPLSPFIQEKIVEAEEYFEEFEKVVTFIDGINDINKIYEECKRFAKKLGKNDETFKDGIEEYYVELEGRKVKQFRYESEWHVVCLIDNMSNLDSKEYGERETMSVFAKDYVRGKLCNFFNFTVIQVLQADFQTERQAFTRDGEQIVAKLEPSLASIGESKVISRSMHLVFSLMDPSRYDILQFPKPPKKHPEKCYDISILKNKFRSLKVIKNNDGETDIRVGLLFDPMKGIFSELPAYGTQELAKVYSKIKGRPYLVKQKNNINYE